LFFLIIFKSKARVGACPPLLYSNTISYSIIYWRWPAGAGARSLVVKAMPRVSRHSSCRKWCSGSWSRVSHLTVWHSMEASGTLYFSIYSPASTINRTVRRVSWIKFSVLNSHELTKWWHKNNYRVIFLGHAGYLYINWK
jgi:hypothetical protein